MTVSLVNGNALSIPLADQSVHCIVTSPPYWGMRDYGLSTWSGGEPGCDHRRHIPQGEHSSSTLRPSGKPHHHLSNAEVSGIPYKDICAKCGAIRQGGGIGLEPTLEEWVDNMVKLGRELWRVLRDDGTLWMNLGDGYNANTGKGFNAQVRYDEANRNTRQAQPSGLAAKNLLGMPWRVALAFQADGWILRSDIIWHKSNPMPESASDRPTKGHEYMFLLTKRPRYYYDAEAIRGESPPSEVARDRQPTRAYDTPERIAGGAPGNTNHVGIHSRPGKGGHNKRTVWTIPIKGYPEAHFATYPPALVEPCVKAGTSQYGVCPSCGAPWVRQTERESYGKEGWGKQKKDHAGELLGSQSMIRDGNGKAGHVTVTTIGWLPSCDHKLEPVAATVFDPFMGSGTTGEVARSLGRNAVGLDLSLEYLGLARARLELDKWAAFHGQGSEAAEANYDDLPLFQQETQ